jgi:serine-aspartate repeat-containing protein C/D/E
VGLWSFLTRCRSQLLAAMREVDQRPEERSRRNEERSRRCLFEVMEERQMLDAAPLRVGAVYIEEDSGSDLHGDTFEIKFEGGAPGTQLTRLVIDTDHGPIGRSVGDLFFDTVKGGWGADEAFPLQIVSSTGIGNVSFDLVDGGTKLVFNFTGFEAGEKLVFSVDVDEVQDFDPAITNLDLINEGVDPITSGVEFQGSMLQAEFTAPHFFDVQGTGEFRNLYDPLFAGSGLLITPSNPSGLPFDNFEGKRDRSTGVMVPLQQQPKPITIAGKVFFDNNRNLVQESNENGIGSVTLALWKKQGNSFVFTGHTTQTNAAGEYQFGLNLNLTPGVYQIRETQPTGLFSVGAIPGNVSGTPTGSTVAGDPDILTEIDMPLGDTHGVRYDFAEALPASIRGHVHLTDPFGNCEGVGVVTRPIAGAVVQLRDQQGNILGQTTTNANGEYEFLDLLPGVYTVVEFTPEGLIDGDEHAGAVNGQTRGSVSGNDIVSNIVLNGGDNGINYDFCEHEPAMISGYVYHDANNDGVRQTSETPIPGTTVILLDASGTQIATQVTNAQGFYKFGGLSLGNYMVVEVQPQGWLDGKDAAGTINGQVVGSALNPGDKLTSINLLWGDNGVEYNFGELKPGRIEGRVHVDSDMDCFFDAGEQPLSGVTVQLLDDQGNIIKTTLTDANGRYSFEELPPGLYAVRELQPAGYLQGGQVAGSKGGDASQTDLIRQIDIDSGDNLVEYNFCEVEPVSLEGLVFVDFLPNCIFDPGDQPLSGVTIRLFNAQGQQVAQTLTDANGRYKFDALPPGTYTVREDQPAGFFQGGQVAGSHGGDDSSTDVIANVTLQSGDDAVEYNFCETPPASIGGIVFVDLLPDCLRQPDEPALAGVTIHLIDQNGEVVATTVTNANGEYRFDNLRPGQYSVREEQPSGYFHGGQVAGSHGGDDFTDDLIADVTLAGGDNATDYNFCEIPPASLSGIVFQDGAPILTADGKIPANLYDLKDGQLTPDDIRIAGVVLELRHTLTGEVVTADEALPGTYPDGPLRAVTNSSGYYEFVGLPRGNYTVIQVHPAGFFDSIDTPGTTSGLAVNLNTTVSPLIVQRFADQGVSFQFDAILQIPLGVGQSSTLNNFSEVKVTQIFIPPPPPPPPPPLPPEQLVIPPTPNPLPLPQLFFPTPAPEVITGGGMNYSWHLSVVNAGLARISARSTQILEGVWRPALFVDELQWKPDSLRQGVWTIHTGENDGPAPHFAFGMVGSIPVVGDWNGDGQSDLGVYFEGEWFLDLNGNGQWDAGDLWAKLGTKADKPVVGDWDGDGKDDIGIYGPEWAGDPRQYEHEPGLPDSENAPNKDRKKNPPPKPEEATDGSRIMRHTKAGKERADLIDHVFYFGGAVDIPIAGDWNGDGIRTVGVFRDGRWMLDTNGDGRWSKGDQSFRFGEKGDLPVVGDFNGDGIDEVGFFRNGQWIIDTNGNREIDAGDRTFNLGEAGDLPVVGDFDGNGTDDPALYRPGGGVTATSVPTEELN